MLKITGKMSDRAASEAARNIASGIKFFLYCVGVAVFLYACTPHR